MSKVLFKIQDDFSYRFWFMNLTRGTYYTYKNYLFAVLKMKKTASQISETGRMRMQMAWYFSNKFPSPKKLKEDNKYI